MAASLRDYMDQREAELKEQQRAIRVELKEIQIARTALASDPSTAAVVTKAAALPTIKEMAMAVLLTAEQGMTSGEILVAIKERYDRDIERTSLSPQLSRLKDDGEVTLSGEKWFTKAAFEKWQIDMVDEATRQLKADLDDQFAALR